MTAKHAERGVEVEAWPTEYVENFVSYAEESWLLEVVAALPYRQDSHRGRLLRRRQCDFGASYAPTGRVGVAEPIPPELEGFRRRVEDFCEATFDQLIVTWYPPGAGIGPHADARWFGEPVAGVSLGDSCILRRGHPAEPPGARRPERLLRPRSLYVLRDRNRWHWRHEIPPSSVRGDRWSLTFRVLKFEASPPRVRQHEVSQPESTEL